MIPDNKDRLVTTITKEQKDKLEKMSKETGVSKSVLVSLALTGLFTTGLKIGETLADLLMKGDKNE